MDAGGVYAQDVAHRLAVGDTFHYLHHHKGGAPVHARRGRGGGQGIVATSVMASAGLAVLAPSEFIPVVRFGMLTGFVVLLALLLDATASTVGLWGVR